MFRRVDQRVRRRHDGGEVADVGRIEAERAKWADVGHSTLGRTACRPMVTGRPHRTIAAAWMPRDGPARNFPGASDVLAATPLPLCPRSRRVLALIDADHQPDRFRRILPPERLVISRAGRLLAGLGLIAALLLPAAAPVAAADGLTMDARTMLDGHARIGDWMAVSVHLKNDGPPISGELRLAGGSQGTSRFGVVVDLPTQSDKTYVVYVQPPAFGRELTLTLVDGSTDIASAKVPYTIHDGTQLVVGVVAERPQDIVSSIHLLPNQNQVAPIIIPLDPTQLPDRVEAWGALDRLVWQDVDSSQLSKEQLAALRGWIAGGGRLVIVGGTSGPGALGAFPDDLLPYRPTATVDVPASSMTAFLGSAPSDAGPLPALAGTLAGGRSLAVVGDRVIAADRAYGSGATALIGFDPTVKWIGGGSVADTFWRRLLPQRINAGLALSDDSQLVSAVAQLPSLALPPIGGLFALLGAYIVLVGPINYFVLRRLGKREWAWATIPAFIALFAVGAYAFGASLRGSEVIVNEIALVRGAPGATDGTAQVYVGIFSPSRGTYQVRVPGGALLSPPVNGDMFGSDTTGTTLDLLQGDPARVRDLTVGFGSLRTVRAETAMAVPLIQADLRLENGHLKGTITNQSDQTLERPAVVLGATVAILKDLGPGQQASVDTAIQTQGAQFGQPLSDLVVGQLFFDNGGGNPDSQTYIRHTIIDQLTFDPNFGSTNQLPADSAVILAWTSGTVLPVEIEGQAPRKTGNTLYYLPTAVHVSGLTTFTSDLLRSSVVASDAAFFSKDPSMMNFGRGSATLAYRPIAMDGSIAADQLLIGLNFGGDSGVGKPTPVEPLDTIPVVCSAAITTDCAQPVVDGIPETELFDLTTSTWVRLPHLSPGPQYAVADPARYVDPTSGTVLIRYVNDQSDGVGFSATVSLRGTVR
jgi:hypothetical protein